MLYHSHSMGTRGDLRGLDSVDNCLESPYEKLEDRQPLLATVFAPVLEPGTRLEADILEARFGVTILAP